MSYTIITIAQLLVLSWGVGLALIAVSAHLRRPKFVSMNTDVQLLALWLLLFLGWLK